MYKIYLIVLLGLIAIVLVVGISIYERRQTQLKVNAAKIDSLQAAIKETNLKFGTSIFRRDCATCHAGRYKTDNYLHGVVNRVGEEYLIKYSTKQDSLIIARDKYAVACLRRVGIMMKMGN